MKKPVYLVCYSFVSSVIVASCSSNVPVTNDVNKIDSVTISQVTKTPAQDNSVKINLKLMSNQPKFGIKATSNAWLSNNVSKVIVRLHTSGTNPTRFDDPATFANASPISEKIIGSLTPTFSGSGFFVPGSIVFNNLKTGNYYASARAYSTSFNNNAGTINATSTAVTTINGTGTTWNTVGSRNRLFKGDIVTIGSDKYTVKSPITNTSFDIDAPGVLTAISASTPYSVESNVTGDGTALGGGMANDGTALGGGTASGVATGSLDEEYVNISTGGALTFVNGGIFGTTIPVRAAGTNQTLDIAIQIMKEYGASADGAVKLFEGAPSDPETVS